MNTWLIFLLALGLALLFTSARAFLVYSRMRGDRLVVCPEMNAYAVVELDAGVAAKTSLTGKPALRLCACSRWEEHGPCAEPCLNQIVEAADGCRVSAYRDGFYRGRHCAICDRTILDVGWTEPMPAMLNDDGRTVAWDAVPLHQLPRLVPTHRPVCWDCHVAATALREHAEALAAQPAR